MLSGFFFLIFGVLAGTIINSQPPVVPVLAFNLLLVVDRRRKGIHHTAVREDHNDWQELGEQKEKENPLVSQNKPPLPRPRDGWIPDWGVESGDLVSGVGQNARTLSSNPRLVSSFLSLSLPTEC